LENYSVNVHQTYVQILIPSHSREITYIFARNGSAGDFQFSICFFPIFNFQFSIFLNEYFLGLAFSESPIYEMCSIAPNKLHNNFKLSYAEGVSYVVQSSHLKIKRSSNLTGILPKTF